MEILKQACLLPLSDAGSELHLSDAPRSLEFFAGNPYSPFPNPALSSFIESGFTDSTKNTVYPSPENVAAGKNTHVYDAHTYHTKVPPEAIVHLIEHFTAPGDLILDPFSGSGMTGVAALQARRKPILIDLSPAATFIALNHLTPMDGRKYFESVEEILAATRAEELALYGTHCRSCGKLVPMEYMVWSYGLTCEFCLKDFVLWDVARDERESVRESKIRTEFDCPGCSQRLHKRKLRRTKLHPVQVGYRCCRSGLQESKSPPDDHDLRLLREIDSAGIPSELWYPTAKLPLGINTRQAISHGLESVRDLYTTRNLYAVARLWDIARRWSDSENSLKLMFTVTSLYQRVTRLSEFRFWGGSGNIANYNVPMIFNEQNVFKVFHRKGKTIRNYFLTWPHKPDTPFCISTQSATDLGFVPDNSIDYIFTDPPFGSNINYSEMNYLWEAWLGVFTQPKDEAIINRVQGKNLNSYQTLMTQAFGEMRRVLKPARWLTLVFHNSSAEVWSAIQAALSTAGFTVESTQTLDKRHGTFKQFVSENAVGYDLILHCQKTLDSSPIIHISPSSPRDVCEFVERTLDQNSEEFIVHYLHVKRRNELDSRKLYSLWLKERMESQEIVDLSYEEFRRIVKSVERKFYEGRQ